MNIFCLDKSPKQSARWMCNKHLSKMCVESIQILSTCFTLERLAEPDCPKTQKGTPRKHFNPKHPSSIWARKTKVNMDWLIAHTLEMEEERLRRNMNPHFCVGFLKWSIKNKDQSTVPDGELTDFSVAINESMNCRSIKGFDSLSSTTKYKLYYLLDKPFAVWSANKPEWMEWTPNQIVEFYENNKVT